MFLNSTGNLTEARQQAKANANQTGVPWLIYTDTAGNVRTCRFTVSLSLDCVIETVYPDPPENNWQHHHPNCGTLFRGCDPERCPKEVYEQTGIWRPALVEEADAERLRRFPA